MYDGVRKETVKFGGRGQITAVQGPVRLKFLLTYPQAQLLGIAHRKSPKSRMMACAMGKIEFGGRGPITADQGPVGLKFSLKFA